MVACPGGRMTDRSPAQAGRGRESLKAPPPAAREAAPMPHGGRSAIGAVLLTETRPNWCAPSAHGGNRGFAPRLLGFMPRGCLAE
jgi:hypothetical protein